MPILFVPGSDAASANVSGTIETREKIPMNRPPVIIIAGPTATGKTAVAIDLCRRFGGEVVGADSMQIYRHMDIGTAKPTPEEQASVPHHLIDMIPPDEPFDAARFAEVARGIIADLYGKGRLPFVVGGTGLYIKALTQGIFQMPPVDPDIRKSLKKTAEVSGCAALHERLARQDPEAAAKIHPNDTYRILRALEVVETTGRPISALHREHRFSESPYLTLKIGLRMARNALYARIDRRVDAMMAAGFVEEVRRLLSMGYGPDLKSMQSIGYRHITDFLHGRMSREDAVDTLKRDTRRYAKRQLTWFGADPDIIWMHPDQIEEMAACVKKFLETGRKIYQ